MIESRARRGPEEMLCLFLDEETMFEAHQVPEEESDGELGIGSKEAVKLLLEHGDGFLGNGGERDAGEGAFLEFSSS